MREVEIEREGKKEGGRKRGREGERGSESGQFYYINVQYLSTVYLFVSYMVLESNVTNLNSRYVHWSL